jgi:hypothetical protein
LGLRVLRPTSTTGRSYDKVVVSDRTAPIGPKPSLSGVDPWHLLAPLKILAGHVHTNDFSLPLGEVVKDYLAEGLLNGARPPPNRRATRGGPQKG